MLIGLSVCLSTKFFQYFFNFRSTSKSSISIHSYRQDEQDGQSHFFNRFFFLVLKSNLENISSYSILVLHQKQAHQRIRPIETNKILIIIFNESLKGIKYI